MASLSALLLATFARWASADIQLPIKPTQPGAAVRVPPDFVSVGFETAFLPNYANDFSENLVSSVAGRMAAPLVIRIGGTSGDRLRLDLDQEEAVTCDRSSDQCPTASGGVYTLGPSYFDAFARFPSAHMTLQAPLGAAENTTSSVEYARRAYRGLTAKRVAGISVGNEVNMYLDGASYGHRAEELQDRLASALQLDDGRVFQAFDLGSGFFDQDQGHKSSRFIADSFQSGLDSQKRIKAVGAHYYQVGSTSKTAADLQKDFMNHTAISEKLDGLEPSRRYLADKHPGIDFVLSETGSTIAPGLPESIPLGFGACLWQADFLLASLARGVRRVVASSRPAALHGPWVPDSSAGKRNPGPQVRAAFSSLPFAADFVGDGTGSVVELDMGSDVLSAYAMYGDRGQLSRVALLNMQAWNGSESKQDRGSKIFGVPVVGASQVTVRRLQAELGTDARGFDYGGPKQNITYAGQQWTHGVDLGKGHMSGDGPQTVPVKQGVASVELPDSEAAIVFI